MILIHLFKKRFQFIFNKWFDLILFVFNFYFQENYIHSLLLKEFIEIFKLTLFTIKRFFYLFYWKENMIFYNFIWKSI